MFENERLKKYVVNIDDRKALFYLQVLASSLSSIVSIMAIRRNLISSYAENPNFFRSKKATRIYIALVLIFIVGTLIYLSLQKRINNEVERAE